MAPGQRAEYVRGYRAQLISVNEHVERLLERILRADPGAAIIIHADHGPGSRLLWEEPQRTDMRERMAILLACRLPGSRPARLWADITPVNLFRVVLNHYFGTRLALAPDESWFSTWSHPYRFLRVTDQVQPVGGMQASKPQH